MSDTQPPEWYEVPHPPFPPEAGEPGRWEEVFHLMDREGCFSEVEIYRLRAALYEVAWLRETERLEKERNAESNAATKGTDLTDLEAFRKAREKFFFHPKTAAAKQARDNARAWREWGEAKG